MKPRTYKILQDCVENGTKYGLHRAHKHTQEPDRDTILMEVVNAVMAEIDDNFSFDDELPKL